MRETLAIGIQNLSAIKSVFSNGSNLTPSVEFCLFGFRHKGGIICQPNLIHPHRQGVLQRTLTVQGKGCHHARENLQP